MDFLPLLFEHEILFVLPATALQGAVAISEFCESSRANVQSLVTKLSAEGGVSENWCLQPPALHAAYEQWCSRQKYHRALPWIWVGTWALVGAKLSQNSGCVPVLRLASAMFTLALLRAILESWLVPFGKALLHMTAVLVRFAGCSFLLNVRQVCFMNVNESVLSSRMGLLFMTAFYTLLFCTMFPVPLEYSLLLVLLNVPAVFVIYTWKYFLMKTNGGALEWGDNVDIPTVVSALSTACVGGQLFLYLRYSLGAYNMSRFLATHHLVQG